MSSREPSAIAQSDRRSLVAMIFVGISGASMMIIMPGVLSALAAEHGWSSRAVAAIAAAEMAGVASGTLGAAMLVAWADRRLLALGAILLLIAAHLTAANSGGYSTFLASRFGGGCAEGVLIATMSAAVAGTARPDRSFAIYMASNLTMSTLLYRILGSLISAAHPERIFLVLVTIAIVAALLLPWFPAHARDRRSSAASCGTHILQDGSVVAGLLATLLLFVGIGATWPLVGQVGARLALSGSTVSGWLSVATFLGILAGMLVSAVEVRFGRSVPIAVGTGAMALCMLGLYVADGEPLFAVSTCGYLFFWVLIVPYFIGVMSALDSTGRMASLNMTMQFIGLTVGPMIATRLIDQEDLGRALWPGILTCPLAIVLMMGAERRLHREVAEGTRRRSTAQP